jgi:hypothetical protein
MFLTSKHAVQSSKFKDVAVNELSVFPKGEIAWSQFYVIFKRTSEAANV